MVEAEVEAVTGLTEVTQVAFYEFSERKVDRLNRNRQRKTSGDESRYDLGICSNL